MDWVSGHRIRTNRTPVPNVINVVKMLMSDPCLRNLLIIRAFSELPRVRVSFLLVFWISSVSHSSGTLSNDPVFSDNVWYSLKQIEEIASFKFFYESTTNALIRNIKTKLSKGGHQK